MEKNGNEFFWFNVLLIAIFDAILFIVPPPVVYTYGGLLVIWLIFCIPQLYDKFKFVKKLQDGLYALSFPYTTDEAFILNAMKPVNFLIGKRFQILHILGVIKEKPLVVSQKTIFIDDFTYFDDSKWDKRFPWGDGNNAPHNVFMKDKQLVIQMQKEEWDGYWDGMKHFHNTAGVIYSKSLFPVRGVYEAKVKFSDVEYINQNFWLLRLRDEPLPKQIEEIDFEYHLSAGKITMTQHWGNGYRHDQLHRQDSFGFKVDLSKGWHTLKFVIKKRTLSWYIDGILVKWHFLGVPKMDQHIVAGVGNVNDGTDVTSTGKLDLNKLPTSLKYEWIKIDKLTMKKKEIITVDDTKYVTVNDELYVGDSYLFLDPDTQIWGFGGTIQDRKELLYLNPDVIRRKIISITS